MLLAFSPRAVYADGGAHESIEEHIADKLGSFESEVDISEYNIAKDDVQETVTRVIEENPNLFYVSTEYKVLYFEETDIAETIYFKFKYSDSELKIKVNDFNSRIRLISEEIMQSETDFEKIHSCHDYIVKNYSYDESMGSTDVYNMLLTGQGTCMAYTGLFGCIMDECGIENTTAKSEELDHIWNVVGLDGEYYNVDVTWDDPVGGVSFSTSHKYLLRSDEYFDTHSHEGGQSSIECSDTSFDSYKWPDESMLTQVEDVDDMLEYMVTSIPLIFAISVSALILIAVILIIGAIKKRKKTNYYYR